MTRSLPSVLTIIVAGALATIAFDAFGKVLAPMFDYARLSPVGLAGSVIKSVFGAGYRPGAEALHIAAGLLPYPHGWLLLARPIWQATLPQVPAVGVASAYGVVLWVFALYGMAHLVAGMKPFLGFTGITWVALWGHVVYALVMVAGLELRLTVPALRTA